jgi:hypothetical protein
MAPPIAGKIAIVIEASPPANPCTRPCSPTLAALIISSWPAPAQDAPDIMSTMRCAEKIGQSQLGLCAKKRHLC